MLKTFVPLIPVNDGRLFEQFITVNCKSLSTLPIKTPFLYSSTITAITVTSSACGVRQMSPVALLNAVTGDEFNGLFALYGAI